MRLIVVCALIAVTALACAAPTDALAKKGQIHACYAKKGQDKGAMRFVRGKKCRHGEKSLKWNKAGLPGPAGQTGATGPAGPAGQGNTDAVDALQAQIDSQAQRISALETELAQLSGQFASFKTLACGQLATLTTQSNALRTVLSGIGLNGVLTGLGGALVVPALPAALPAFSC